MYSKNLDHRPDIEGLRCLAVVSVLLYHLEFDIFAGGFLGVDIFFVISGFLITRMILSEVERTGRFRFGNFYLRRTRRLYPAFIATVGICLIGALLLFTPKDLARLGGSSIFAATGLSNLFFWRESGYFDASAQVKPLLHTWSLSVEAQFYLIWPLMLWCTFHVFGVRWRILAALFLSCGAASFAAHVVVSDGFTAVASLGDLFADGAASTFYLTPFRVFEFAIGAVLVVVPTHRWQRVRWVNELGCILGVALILFSVLAIDQNAVTNTFALLVPCIGTGLLIACGRSTTAAAPFRTRPAVFVGCISYSLYLVHWPLIVFYDYVTPGSLASVDRAVIICLSFAGAVGLHFGIEKRFRYPGQRSAFPRLGPLAAPGGLAMIVPVAVLGYLVWTQQGWAWRIANPTPVADASEGPCEDVDNQPCLLDGRDSLDTIWIGDSLAKQYAPVLVNDPTFAEIMYFRGGCPMLPLMTRLRDGNIDARCLSVSEDAYSQIAETNNKTIVISMYWRAYFEQTPELVVLRDGSPVSAAYSNSKQLFSAALRELHSLTLARGHRVYIVDHVRDEGFDDWHRCHNTPLRLCDELDADLGYAELNSGSPLADPAMQALLDDLGFTYFTPLANLCDKDSGLCPPFRNGSQALLVDHIHFSPEGARSALLGEQFNFFGDILGKPNQVTGR